MSDRHLCIDRYVRPIALTSDIWLTHSRAFTGFQRRWPRFGPIKKSLLTCGMPLRRGARRPALLIRDGPRKGNVEAAPQNRQDGSAQGAAERARLARAGTLAVCLREL